MKINPRYKVRQVAGENIVLIQGRNPGDMTTVVALNESSLFLWNQLEGKEFDVEQLADLLTDHFEVDRPTALRDAEAWVENLRSNNILA